MGRAGWRVLHWAPLGLPTMPGDFRGRLHPSARVSSLLSFGFWIGRLAGMATVSGELGRKVPRHCSQRAWQTSTFWPFRRTLCAIVSSRKAVEVVPNRPLLTETCAP